MTIRRMIRIENALFFGFTFFVYHQFGFSLLQFFLLLLAPDLSIIGYLRSKQFGALIYNIGHTFILPVLLLLLSLYMKWDVLFSLSLIWCAHIFMDRSVGYGLKYPTSFKSTHSQRY
ncbi:DUF4260 family protein [Sporosarcina obsidiansis]|uniref:DUF4260 family protein n=1 Tax=Sporosarcina obsidiansis TaxID=2660748 RepID=UPI00129AAFF4|nr:DUF4260 family protein [Sporosarcina obsidiansis]